MCPSLDGTAPSPFSVEEWREKQAKLADELHGEQKQEPLEDLDKFTERMYAREVTKMLRRKADRCAPDHADQQQTIAD